MDSWKECLYFHSTNFDPKNPSYRVHTHEGLSLCVIRVFWSPVSVGRTYNNLWPSHTYKHIKILIAYCRPSHWRFCSQDGYFYSHWGGPIIWATSWSSETTVCNFSIQIFTCFIYWWRCWCCCRPTDKWTGVRTEGEDWRWFGGGLRTEGEDGCGFWGGQPLINFSFAWWFKGITK